MNGRSLMATLQDAGAGEFHPTQYFEMLGSRSLYHDGWKATTKHISAGVLDEEELAVGSRNFANDQWELFNLSEDFSEAVDRSAEEPARLQQMTDLWTSEAERNQVLPISDGMLDRFSGFIGAAYPAGTSQTYHPGGGPVHDESVPLLWGGFQLTADFETAGVETAGVVCAMGDWFGGYALYLTGEETRFNFARSSDVLQLRCPTPADDGTHRVVVSYTLAQGDAPGRMTLSLDGNQVDETAVEGMLPMALQHGGTGLRLGHDSGFPVSADYTPPAPFTGVVHQVTISTPGGIVPDPADEVRAALHGD
jgi:hypothetical protein